MQCSKFIGRVCERLGRVAECLVWASQVLLRRVARQLLTTVMFYLPLRDKDFSELIVVVYMEG